MIVIKEKVLILGATSDMAMAIGRVFAQNGFDLILAARRSERLQPYVKDVKNRFDTDAQLIDFDASNTENHEQIANSLSEECQVAICVFGYLGDQKVAEESWEESHKIITANYIGAVSILNHIATKWKPRRQGTLIGVSSVAGDRGRGSNYIYGSAKAGFTAYLAGLRNNLFHHDLHVVTINPGFVATKMTSHLDLPPKLTSSPEQVALAVFKAFKKKKNFVYVSGIWRWIMLIIKNIPEPIFKKLKM